VLALKCLTKVDSKGRIILHKVPFKKGSPVEAIVLPCEVRTPDDLLLAALSSLSFWDNPIDDEVWNDA
jgi:hypothetical protein